jgi:hypothetical protein
MSGWGLTSLVEELAELQYRGLWLGIFEVSFEPPYSPMTPY